MWDAVWAAALTGLDKRLAGAMKASPSKIKTQRKGQLRIENKWLWCKIPTHCGRPRGIIGGLLCQPRRIRRWPPFPACRAREARVPVQTVPLALGRRPRGAGEVAVPLGVVESRTAEEAEDERRQRGFARGGLVHRLRSLLAVVFAWADRCGTGDIDHRQRPAVLAVIAKVVARVNGEEVLIDGAVGITAGNDGSLGGEIIFPITVATAEAVPSLFSIFEPKNRRK